MSKSEVFNLDCLEGMKQYPDNYFDLAVVDPPYGASDALEKDKDNSINHVAKRKAYHQFENIAPNEDYFIELKRVSKNQIVWGGNFFGLSGGVIAWNKNGTAFGEGEVAICTTHKSVRFFEYTWNGMLQGDMKNKESRIHPTQKPVALYDWIFEKYAKQGQKILDTHLGSQSSRIAAYKAGLDFTGFELDTDYFNEGCKRFEDFKIVFNQEVGKEKVLNGQSRLF
jgi:site-specific DNA-methyltransferase (adenine-specific)